LVEDNFEVLTPTEVDANFSIDESPIQETQDKVRKLCACGCGEPVTGNRALKRGHTMGEGLPPSVFGGNDIVVFQLAMVALVGAITHAVERKLHVPAMEPEETRGIGEPLGRIAARHIPKALLKRMKPGDAADAIAVVMIMSAYIVRITTSEKQEIPEVATNGYVNDQTVSGLQQYSYTPPDQGYQSQNVSTN
jgi:hypothetical protein